jgi:hypothetical protein
MDFHRPVHGIQILFIQDTDLFDKPALIFITPLRINRFKFSCQGVFSFAEARYPSSSRLTIHAFPLIHRLF